MNPLCLPLHIETDASPSMSANAMAYLDHLRHVSMRCRVMPRTGLFEACALLQPKRSATRNAHSVALMRCLNEALNGRAKLHAPGSSETTFDERWLVQLGIAFGQADEASCQFLLCSRVVRENRRLVRYLVSHIAQNFSLN